MLKYIYLFVASAVKIQPEALKKTVLKVSFKQYALLSDIYFQIRTLFRNTE